MEKLKVGLFNDSFPPTIDGVANVTLNYARIIQRDYGEAIVATPHYPHTRDDYPFRVLRYPSAYISKTVGYRAGFPFDPVTISELRAADLDILHSHCPFVSTLLARQVRRQTGKPIVFTYHTKFDIDIDKVTASDSLRRASIAFIVNNINACDEVWVVSEGAGENLRSLGYTGDYIVMPNGVDFERRPAGPDLINALRARHGIAPEETVFLFVGRMMWYKGVRLSLDGLARAHAAGENFRFILVGDGVDRPEIEQYAAELGLSDRCIFTGAIQDREELRAYFSLADLFLFPSSFDTNGIVVREAAACSCPSLLLRGSCAAEGIRDGETGILIEEDPAQMADRIIRACHAREAMRQLGERAAAEIYLSWDDAIAKACDRYHALLDGCAYSRLRDESTLARDMDAVIEHLVDEFAVVKENFQELMWDTRDWVSRLHEKAQQRLRQTEEEGHFPKRRP